MSLKKTRPIKSACEDCESVAVPLTRLTGNRSRYGLTLGSAVFFGVGSIALTVAVIVEPPGWIDQTPPWMIPLRIFAGTGLGLGFLLLLMRLMHTSVAVCSACGSTSIVPLDTPRGMAIAGTQPCSPERNSESEEPRAGRTRNSPAPAIIVVVLVVTAAAGLGLAGGYSACREVQHHCSIASKIGDLAGLTS